ncbi:hypothetical protein KSP40_PGU012306 [Platanthera guangdongensis]|uniref:Uncharacterized protein n=1 Tax=Platanthera guangdongensis TaxID=2320717 RepID=A0ABR2LT22_9ASPA
MTMLLHQRSHLFYPHMKLEKLKSLCLQYAASIQLLVPSIYISDAAESYTSAESKARRSKGRIRLLKSPAEITIFSDSITKFENNFNDELQRFRPILSSGLQAEPYLTHLAQCILGAANEK